MFLNYLYLVTLLNFEGVLCIYVLLYHEGKAEYHSCYVFYMWNKQMSFNALLSMIFVCILSCCMHRYYVLLLELHLSCSCLEYFDPSFQCLQMVWSWLWWCMSPQKLFFLFITYLLEDEQELSLGMLIRRKRIYNFWCSMLVLHQLLYVLRD